MIEESKEDERTILFLKLFKILLNAYQQELTKSKTIDFGDMISQSAKLVSQKKELSDYKYIIIDEFQDISDGRYDLILQFLNQSENTKLFCVGDDWQAIYRFAGSDQDHDKLSKPFWEDNNTKVRSNLQVQRSNRQGQREVHNSKPKSD